MHNVNAHLSHEERKQAMSDAEIADEMEHLIVTFRNKLWADLLLKAHDLSTPQRRQCVDLIHNYFGNTGLSDAIADITYGIKCQSADVLGERAP